MGRREADLSHGAVFYSADFFHAELDRGPSIRSRALQC